MNSITWNKWLDDWKWIIAISQKRNWNFAPIDINPKIDNTEIDKIENEFGIKYPLDFKTVLTEYAGGISFGWQIENEDTEGEFKPIFCGVGGVSNYKPKPFLWNFESLSALYKTYLNWLKDCFNDPTDPYDAHYYDKIPFIDVGNGDLIVFNTGGEIIYLSHDDGPLHGEKLADNFIEFITLLSNLGCIGNESDQFEVFYDEKNQKLMDNDLKIERWKNWLEK